MIHEPQVWFSFEKGKRFDFEKGGKVRGMIVASTPKFSLVQLRCEERIQGFNLLSHCLILIP